MNKAENKVIDKLNRALFAEHLYNGLTVKKNYGLVEATRHWNAAKYNPSEYAFIEFPGVSTSCNDLAMYLEEHDALVAKLEDYLREQGTLNLSYEELDELAKTRGEK